MATTKIWPVHGYLGSVVNYAENADKTKNPNYTDIDLQSLRDVMHYTTQDYKTEKQFYVSGINCSPDIARQQMIMTKKRYGKEGGTVAFHAYQSFKPGEVTPSQAHEIGMKLAQQLWGNRFEVVVATHLDKEHIHCHFVLNSVSFADGKRYNDCKKTYRLLRETSDRICKEHSLSVIKNPSTTHTPRNIHMAEKAGKPTLYNVMRWDINEVIGQSKTLTQFISLMDKQGYELNLEGKYWTIKAQGSKHPTRLFRLGEDYTENAIKLKLAVNYFQGISRPKPLPEPRHYRFKGTFNPKRKIGGLRGLYLHYCYLMGILPKNNPPRPVHPSFKAELLKLDEYIRQTKLLCSHKIETNEQLLNFIENTTQQIVELTAERTKIYNHLRRCSDPEKISSYKSDRDTLSKQLYNLRKDLRSANGILERSSRLKSNIEQVKPTEPKQNDAPIWQKQRGYER